jgi:dTDP-4-amino-4,6-dideoxygalactose transaminase
MIPRYAPTYTYSDLFNCLKSDPGEKQEEGLSARLSNLFQVKHVFLTESARVGLYLILRAYDRPGRVLMPAYNVIVVPEAVHYAGYQPGFVDIEPCILNVSSERWEKAITPDTTAVLAVHLFGIPCNMEEIQRLFKSRDILIIEDAAPALGAEYGGKTVGSFGDVSLISFRGIKVISGEAGAALLTNNDELARKIQGILSTAGQRWNTQSLFLRALALKIALSPAVYATLRHGSALLHKELMYEVVPATLKQPKGYVSGMPGFASALVQTQLDRLEWNLSRRRKIAQIYRDQLVNHASWLLPEIPAFSNPSWIQFPMICADKLAFYKYMRSVGVDMSWTYKYSCAESFGFSDYPNAQQAAKKVISLPTTPFLTDEQVYEICFKALRFNNSKSKRR